MTTWIVADCIADTLVIVNTPTQLGLTHVSVIVSRLRDSITSVWYYVSHRRDTSF